MDQPVLYRSRYLLPISSPPIEDGAVLACGRVITAVGSARRLRTAHPTARMVDFGDAVMLPPMVNAHTHLELSDFPRWTNAAGDTEVPRDFVAWILRLVRVRHQVGPAALRDSLAAGLRAVLAAGTGAVGDILTTLEALPTYRQSPLRGRVFAEVLGHDLARVDDRLAAIAALLSEPPTAELAWGLAPHAPYTLSSSAIDLVFAFARQHALQSSIHLAESAEETRFLTDGSGALADRLFAAASWDPVAEPPPACSPVRTICRRGRLGRNDLAVHGVQVDATDIARFKAIGCSVVLCPRSNANLAVGSPPVGAYLDAGIPLALGTDSLASAPSLSIWDEIAFARRSFPGQASPRDWLTIATSGGARALGQDTRLGQLRPGLEVSFQVVTPPQLPALDELEEALCSCGPELRVSHLYLAACNVLPEN